ncbi:hypothetical protein K435DRAFT_922085 [Dendrothele bispora CBS 962.96]|uniref:Uncharacterized protein n=1 Tax=Dendrothele bispora (strain CBS 962.96) TaxID=1314807 RepID=A0A4S8MI51_DENBC|nr:hypothetical protein K435DRAFT_922085 [Dendrothele bispora CBS 962.96]
MAGNVTLVLDDSVFIDQATSECWYIAYVQRMAPGTIMEFYGFTPPRNTDQTFIVTFGGSSVAHSIEEYPKPNVEDLFYTSTVAEDSAIWTIDIFTNGPQLFFDYAVVTVTELESLQGQTIIVDDSNTEINWAGSWVERKNYTLYGLLELDAPNGITSRPEARPHGNSTHESDGIGDSFIFQFQGTSILVAGVAPLNRTVESFTVGDHESVLDPPVSNFRLELNFTLDGHSESVVYTNGGFPQPGGSPHFPYLRNDSLSEGNHTLIMTVVDVTGNTSVVIDYITYKPSFATAGDKPTFPPISITGSNNTAPAPGPSGTQGSNPTQAPGHKFNKGAIAGGVVGGIVVLALLALHSGSTKKRCTVNWDIKKTAARVNRTRRFPTSLGLTNKAEFG